MENNKDLLRVLDANFNRLREGLRVVEEVFRLVLDDSEVFTTIKALRHDVALCNGFFSQKDLLDARDSNNDVGREGSIGAEMNRSGLGDLLTANFKRCQEAARVIEEFSKAGNPEASVTMKNIRFRLYTFEKDIVRVLPL